jgi:hypothetical protein
MANKRDLLKKIKMELWVMETVGISKDRRLSSPEVQAVKVPVYFTIGELRAIQRALIPARRDHQ